MIVFENIFFFKVKGCNKMVIKNTQMPSTNVPMHPVKQITNVNHLSNEKSE